MKMMAKEKRREKKKGKRRKKRKLDFNYSDFAHGLNKSALF